MNHSLGQYFSKNRDRLPLEYQTACLDLQQYIYNSLGEGDWAKERKALMGILQKVENRYPWRIPPYAVEKVAASIKDKMLDLSMCMLLPNHIDAQAYLAVDALRETHALYFPYADISKEYYDGYGKYFRMLFDRVLAGYLPQHEAFMDVPYIMTEKMQNTAYLLDRHDDSKNIFSEDPEMIQVFEKNKKDVAQDLRKSHEEYAYEILLQIRDSDGQILKKNFHS